MKICEIKIDLQGESRDGASVWSEASETIRDRSDSFDS